ncbi:protein FAM181B [Aquila chrysaetos chrysaetos]|uniref:protein FAM181B n=1 Tax=Aquila chrysaetos chrysaetos TaxID=223781 RepID=UPI001176878F|nr:protein FAM181B [Aquila chrysaetos chrysaetos]
MAVPAALLSPHHLLSFCFPAAAGGLLGYGDLEKGYEGGGAGEAGDFKEATRDLLSFIDSASSNIKLALDKPVKSKRKVNHRKYLQKQIKRCTGIIAAPPPPPPAPPPPPPASSSSSSFSSSSSSPPAACPAKPPPRREASQAASSLQSKSLAALFGSLQQGRGPAGGGGGGEAAGGGAASGGGGGGGGGGAAAGGPRKVPLRDRNLPPSFFTEPALPPAAARGPPPGAKELEKGGGGGGGGGGAEATEFFELLGPEYGALLPEHAAPPDAFPGGGAAARLPAELGLEHGLYEAPLPLPAAHHHHPLLGGLLYPEPPWSPAGPCSPPKKAPAEALRPLYPGGGEPAPGGGGGGEEPGGHLSPGFAPFFPECPLPPPQVPYDYSAGYHRPAYPGL